MNMCMRLLISVLGLCVYGAACGCAPPSQADAEAQFDVTTAVVANDAQDVLLNQPLSLRNEAVAITLQATPSTVIVNQPFQLCIIVVNDNDAPLHFATPSLLQCIYKVRWSARERHGLPDAEGWDRHRPAPVDVAAEFRTVIGPNLVISAGGTYVGRATVAIDREGTWHISVDVGPESLPSRVVETIVTVVEDVVSDKGAAEADGDGAPSD